MTVGKDELDREMREGAGGASSSGEQRDWSNQRSRRARSLSIDAEWMCGSVDHARPTIVRFLYKCRERCRRVRRFAAKSARFTKPIGTIARDQLRRRSLEIAYLMCVCVRASIRRAAV